MFHYLWSSTPAFNPDTDLPDLTGKVIIVTGGNAGIGYGTVQHLARHGAKVYMATRSESKALAAVEQLKKEGLGPGNGEIVYLSLDLADPHNAKNAGLEFMEKEQRLDILINNAAMMMAEYGRARYDIQDIMMTNHIGPFVFTMTLLPLLKKTANEPGTDVRIVNLTSNAIYSIKDTRFRGRVDFNDDHAKAWSPGFARYGRTKLANILFTKSLQKQFDEAQIPIIAISVHPGVVYSRASQIYDRQLNPFLGALFKFWASNFFTDIPHGAYTSVLAAAWPNIRQEAEKYKATYLIPVGKITKPTDDALKPELADELWNTTMSLLKEMDVAI